MAGITHSPRWWRRNASRTASIAACGRDGGEDGVVVEDGEVGHRARDSLPPWCPTARPQLEIVAPSASPEEAAAVVAALERFMRETAPPAAPAAAAPAQPLGAGRAARGRRARVRAPAPWGDPHALGLKPLQSWRPRPQGIATLAITLPRTEPNEQSKSADRPSPASLENPEVYENVPGHDHPDHRAGVRRLRQRGREVPRRRHGRGRVHRLPPEAGRLRPAPGRRPDDPRQAARWAASRPSRWTPSPTWSRSTCR